MDRRSSAWHIARSSSSARGGGGGGGYLTKFYTGRLRPEAQPLTLSYTILAEKYPFYIPFIEKRYPFHIPILGSLVLVFM